MKMLCRLVFVACWFVIAAENVLNCPVCDQNDYDPVCAEGKAYSNLCTLKREICLGKVVLHDWKYGTCTVLKEPLSSSRGDNHDERVVFRLFSK